MDLSIELERGAGKPAPLYRQIADRIERLIDGGRLAVGARLPTVRRLADDLDVTVVTVQSAYAHLQDRGLAEAVVGRGTFVTRPVSAVELPDDEQRTPEVIASIVRLERDLQAQYPMAQASGGADFSPADEFMRCLAAQEPDAAALLRYGPSQGSPVLRSEIADLLARRGLDARPDELIVTQGVTQSLDLLLTVLCKPGDTVLVEEPTYLGLIGLAELHGVSVVGVPLDDEGPRRKRLESALRSERPRFFYCTPTFNNPTGLCMSEARRRQLLDLADEYDLLIVEDDIYRDVELTEPPPPPPLKVLDGGRERVVYVDGFAKSLLPGLRVGYMMPPAHLHRPLLEAHRLRTLCGSLVIQAALAEFLRRGGRDRYLDRALPVFRERREVLLRSLAAEMPEGCEWIEPAGGLCLWLTLPEGVSTGAAYRAAVAAGVSVAPGDRFMPRPTARGHLRLSFGTVPAERIPAAIKALGAAIESTARGAHGRPADEAIPLV